ncbi:MAG: hypothetical protein DMF53_10295 [Acidobacteria bacterium]|nr:MAG: hypothetical protein DMF53_10295 [Acidobacteriota bacterium]
MHKNNRAADLFRLIFFPFREPLIVTANIFVKLGNLTAKLGVFLSKLEILGVKIERFCLNAERFLLGIKKRRLQRVNLIDGQ